MTDYKALADTREKEWSTLFARMDNDRDLVNLFPYILKDTEAKPKEIPHAVSVTLNDLAVFAVNVEASLGGASEQVVVESEDKKLDTSKVEAFIKAAFKAADKLLSNQGRYNLNPFTDQQTCRRGRCAARCLFQVNNKTKDITAEIIPWDTRYLVYGMDAEGLAWTSYKTWRSKDMVIADYPLAKVDDKTVEIEVQDIWVPDHNEVWVAGSLALEQKNPFGKVPVVIQVVPMGSMLMDKDSLKYQGESIFFLIRDLVPELNRLVSIIQSLNVKALDRALQLRVPDIELPLSKPPEHDVVTNPRAVTGVPIGGGFDLMPIGELQQQAWLLHQMIETRIQRGGISNFDMGTFTQPMSAIALIQIGEGRDQVFMPRLGTRGLSKQRLAEMFIDQIRGSGASQIKLGGQTYKVSDLEGEYDISFKYTVKSPGKDVARYSMAAGAGSLISEKTKRSTILELEDPEGEERQLRSEEAERLFSTIKQYRTVKALMEDAERGDEDAQLEAEMAAAEMGLTLKQVLAGQGTQLQPVEAQKPKALPLVPLMTATGGARQSPLQEQVLGGNK